MNSESIDPAQLPNLIGINAPLPYRCKYSQGKEEKIHVDKRNRFSRPGRLRLHALWRGFGLGILDGITREVIPAMKSGNPKVKNSRHRHARSLPDSDQMRDRIILSGLAALLAFIGVYAYSDRATFVFALASGIGVAIVSYIAMSARQHREG